MEKYCKVHSDSIAGEILDRNSAPLVAQCSSTDWHLLNKDNLPDVTIRLRDFIIE